LQLCHIRRFSASLDVVTRDTGDDELERVTFSWPEKTIEVPHTDPGAKLLATSLGDFVGRADPAAPWQVTVTWRFTEDAAIPVAVEVRSNHGPITARAWRTIRVQEVIDASRRRLSTELQIEALRGDFGPDVTPELAGAVFEERSEPKRRPGRPRHLSDEFLAEVAAVYLDAVAHQSRRPVREVAERLGSIADAPSTAKAWVSEARRRGFIPREESRS
jgi:hypothetical protein